MVRIPVDSRLLKVLIRANFKEFNKLEELAEFVGVSTRTIRNYIKELNSIIVLNNIAEIVQIKEAGYKVIVYNQLKFDELIAQADLQNNNVTLFNNPEDRLMYILEVLINATKIIKIDELAHDINIGRTTLINDLKKIEALFKLYNIDIKGKQNLGIRIEGNELNIRLLILDYLCKGFIKNAISNSYYKTINNDNYEKIKTLLIEIFATSKFHLSDETLMETLNYIMIMLIRVNDNRYIRSLEKKYENIVDSEEYNLSAKIIEMIVKQIDCNLNEYEAIFITLPLIGRKASINFNNIIIKSSVKLLAEEIINEINENLAVSIKYDNAIVESFIYHLNFMLNRLIFNIKIKNELTNEIKRNYPLAYEMAKLAAKVIEKSYTLRPGEDEIGYMALYFGSYIEQDSYPADTINKVALVCGTGLGSSQFLNIKLRKLLGKNVVINNYSDMKLTKELLDQYDIVFTTVEITINTETPIIQINVLFDKEDLKNSILKKINYKKYNLEHFQTKDPILSIMMQKEHFFILEKENYMDNLEFMLDELFNLGEVDVDFRNRIIERELKGATSFGNYIALPHAINYKSDRLLIAFGVLKKNIIWSGEEVKIIILLMIPTEDHIDKELLVKAYEQLLKLAQNKQAIVNMSKLKSYTEFKNLLIKEINL